MIDTGPDTADQPRLLWESGRFGRVLFESSPIPITVIDAVSYRSIDCNPAAVKMYGYASREELLGKTPVDVSPPAQYDGTPSPAKAAEYIGQCLREGSVVFDWLQQRPDGTTWDAEVHLQLLRLGERELVQCSMLDITERKRAEEEIRKLNQELEERVRIRTRQLESANRSLDEFAYVVSHDLKAPLRGVSQLAHWVRDDYARVLDEEGRRRLDLMGSRITRMYALIDGILAYSRIGRTEERREAVDLQRLVGEAVEALSPPPNVRVVIEGGLPMVTADRTRMEQVFQNLIGNALKFMDKPDGQIAIRCEDAGDRWRLSVTDNGPGIDPKYHEKVFRIFQTLTARAPKESTGIGLTLVKKIVEQCGGRIELVSEVGKGCKFSFTLPK